MPLPTPSTSPKKRDGKSKEEKDRKRKRPHEPAPQSSIKKPRHETPPPSTFTSTMERERERERERGSSPPNSPFHIVKSSFYISLAPKYSFWPTHTYSHLLNPPPPSKPPTVEQARALRSLTPFNGLKKDHLDPLLMSFYEPVGGVVLAYNNIQFQSETATIKSESPFAHVWILVDLLVWKPKPGMVLDGWVNLQSESHVGLLVENTWNVSIPREKIPEGWEWQEVREGFVSKRGGFSRKSDGGTMGVDSEALEDEGGEAFEEESTGGWMDGNGQYVDGLLKFRVESIKAMGHIFSMEGSLLDTEEAPPAASTLKAKKGGKVEAEQKKKKKRKKQPVN